MQKLEELLKDYNLLIEYKHDYGKYKRKRWFGTISTGHFPISQHLAYELRELVIQLRDKLHDLNSKDQI